MRPKLLSTTRVAALSAALLVLSCATSVASATDQGKVRKRAVAVLKDQWRLGTLSRISHLLVSHEECGSAGDKASEACRKVDGQSAHFSDLQEWAQSQTDDWPNLLRAARLRAEARSLFKEAKYEEAEEAMDKAITLQLFPFGVEQALTRWHSSLLDPEAVVKHQRQELADSFVLLAAACLEDGYKNQDIRQLMKSHFALDTAMELYLLDNLGVNQNEYTNILHMDILGALEETIPTATSGQLKEIVADVGLECASCENDFDFRGKIMEAVQSGVTFNVDEAIRDAEIGKCTQNQILQQSTSIVLHQLSAFLSSAMLTQDAAVLLHEGLARPCYSKTEGGPCDSFFFPDLQRMVQCVDVDGEGVPLRQPVKKARFPSLNEEERWIRNVVREGLDFPGRDEGFSSCSNPSVGEQLDLESGKGKQASAGGFGAGSHGGGGSTVSDFEFGNGRLERDLQKEATAFVGESKGDDPIVPIILVFMIVIYCGSWMLWKNRKSLRRRVAKYGLWKKEPSRENSQDTQRLRVAIASGEIHKLEQALGEVNNADPATLRRARSLLSQKKKAKKEQDQQKARAKQAKQRASAQKREERNKRGTQGSEPISTAATIAAVRAKVERERQDHSGHTNNSAQQNQDSSVSDEDFISVADKQGRLRRRANTTGSAGKPEGGEPEPLSSSRKNSDCEGRQSHAAQGAKDRPPAGRQPRRSRGGSGDGHYVVRGRRSFDKNGGPGDLPKGRDAYASFRKSSLDRNDASGLTERAAAAQHPNGESGSATGRYVPPNRREGRLSGGSSHRRPPLPGPASATRYSRNEYVPAGQGGGHHQHHGRGHRGSRRETPSGSNSYGSSLYQADLIGSLVGSYSPFMASNNGGGGGGGSRAQASPAHASREQKPSEQQWTRKARNPALASMPKHMRANSFPEVDHDFEVDLNSSQGTVEWLPNLE